MMKLTTNHPSVAQLQAFAQGFLEEEEFVWIESHLADCHACCEQLSSLPDGSLMSLAREVVTLGNAQASNATRWEGIPADLRHHPRYRIMEKIGEGGMGTVYRAEHRVMQRVVAVKLVHPWLLSKPQAIERFEKEVQLAAKLVHPNIVLAHDADRTEHRHFLVMEHVVGETLQERIRKEGPSSIRQACDWIRQASRGLQHAWDHGMAHRDIKPANLMVTPDQACPEGRLRILDFGLSRLVAVPDPESASPPSQDLPTTSSPFSSLKLETDLSWDSIGGRTETGLVLGTPDYIAPEQIVSSGEVDIRADIYSLGCTLFYLLAGRAPFEGSVNAILRAHATLPIPDLSAWRNDIPPKLMNVIRKMTAKRRDDRYGSPREVESALAEWCDTPESPTVVGKLAATQVQPSRGLPVRRVAIGLSLFAMAGLIYATLPRRRHRLLVLLPSEGLWFQDYDRLVEASREAGSSIDLVFASVVDRPSKVFFRSEPGIAVPDVKLDSSVRADQYSGLVVIGYETREFSPGGVAGEETSRLITEFQMQKKPIAAMCAGQRILAQHGALRGKEVVPCQSVSDKEIEVEGGRRSNLDVQADGLVISASSADHAKDFLKKIAETLSR